MAVPQRFVYMHRNTKMILSSARALISSALWPVSKSASQKYHFVDAAHYFTRRRPPTSADSKQNGYCLLTYIWIDGTKVNVRAKTLVVNSEPSEIKDIPHWRFDGSSTYQSETGDSDLTLKPVAMCRDPFFKGKSKLVLCEVLANDGAAVDANHRISCAKVAEKVKHLEPLFAFEQEYTLFSRLTGKPYGWPPDGFPGPQGPFYCGVGDGTTFGRSVSDRHLQACLCAGLRIGGTNAEVMPSQWEYQLGPLPPLETADQLWLSRYILARVGEEFGVSINYDPKPLAGDWNGAGNHVNFSTKPMRVAGGLKAIEEAIKKMSRNHRAHIEVYDPSGGIENRRRLTGKHETASVDKFSFGVGQRNVSVRIPRPVAAAGMGHLEDRRPAANCDPYMVVERILRTTCIDDA